MLDLTEYDKVVTTKDTMMINIFLSCIIHARMRTAYTGAGLNAMTQALHAEDGSLPQGLTIQNAFTEICNGSMNVAVVVLCKAVWSNQLISMCLGVIILHMIVCTVIHNCSSSGSLFFTSLRQNN